MKTKTQTVEMIGPEDIAPGDYLAVTHLTCDLLIYTETAVPGARQIKTEQATIMCPSAGQPYKVVKVCVPFVLVRDATGQHMPLDLRRHRVVKLPVSFGKAASKAIRGKTKACKAEV